MACIEKVKLEQDPADARDARAGSPNDELLKLAEADSRTAITLRVMTCSECLKADEAA
jgi:hypothetical protein